MRKRALASRCTIIGVLLIGLTACTGLANRLETLGPRIDAINAMAPDQARAVIADRTLMTYDPQKTACYTYGKYPTCTTTPGHGTQVEYYAPDGSAYLWYPGNTAVVVGEWEATRNRTGERYLICFRYFTAARNPITGIKGTDLVCDDLGLFAAGVVDRAPSDPFDLASGKVPYRLSRKQTTIEELIAAMPGQPAASR